MATDRPGTSQLTARAEHYRGPGRGGRAARLVGHRRNRAPRGHWVLVSLVMFVFAIGLLVEGYTRGVLGENSADEPRPAPHAAAAPSAVTGGGPVVQVTPAEVVYRQLMYLVTIQSVITALLGTRQRWQVIRRAGVFAGPAAGT